MLPGSYEVDTVTTPDEALERAETGQYDLIFLDINLKDKLDGTDLLERMRAMDAAHHALMIAITAYAMPGDGDRFREQGFDGYVPKPFTYDTLRENLIQVFD
jgi:two-component system cell cycle response regulator DivK